MNRRKVLVMADVRFAFGKHTSHEDMWGASMDIRNSFGAHGGYNALKGMTIEWNHDGFEVEGWYETDAITDGDSCEQIADKLKASMIQLAVLYCAFIVTNDIKVVGLVNVEYTEE